MSLNSTSCYVDNVNGFPVSGNIILGEEIMSYVSKNLATNELFGISRGINGTTPTVHIPGEDIFINLPAVLVLNQGRGYVNPPRVTAYIDTSIYPAPRVIAQFEPVMSLGILIGVNVINSGEGYAVLPKIIIDPAFTVSVASTNSLNWQSSSVKSGSILLCKSTRDYPISCVCTLCIILCSNKQPWPNYFIISGYRITAV